MFVLKGTESNIIIIIINISTSVWCQSICSAGWIDFWWVPIGAISINYIYHPCPPLGPTPQADISTPVKEEILLSPMRFPHQRKIRKRSPDGTQKFDPTILASDTVNVELEIGPSVLLLYGTALRNFMNFKVFKGFNKHIFLIKSYYYYLLLYVLVIFSFRLIYYVK